MFVTNFLDEHFGWGVPEILNIGLNQTSSTRIFGVNGVRDDPGPYIDDDVRYWSPDELRATPLYAVNFAVDRSGRSGFPIGIAGQSESNAASLYKQGYGLSIAIRRVLEASGAERVILVGHCMGGLAIREYLQRTGPDGAPLWWVDSPGVAPRHHRVAKVVTIGTPHGGAPLANWTGWLNQLGVGNFSSEALRDLTTLNHESLIQRTRGIALFGGFELNLEPGWDNNDINNNGLVTDKIANDRWFKPLNAENFPLRDNPEMPLPGDIEYFFVVGDLSGHESGNFSDGVVPVDLAWLPQTEAPFKRLTVIAKHSGGGIPPMEVSPLLKRYETLIEALNEPDSPGLAYRLPFGRRVAGFITGRGDGERERDVDYFRFDLGQALNVRLSIENFATPDGRIVLYHEEGREVFNTLAANQDFAADLHLPSGTYYLRLEGAIFPESHLQPYRILLEAQPHVSDGLVVRLGSEVVEEGAAVVLADTALTVSGRVSGKLDWLNEVSIYLNGELMESSGGVEDFAFDLALPEDFAGPVSLVVVVTDIHRRITFETFRFEVVGAADWIALGHDTGVVRVPSGAWIEIPVVVATNDGIGTLGFELSYSSADSPLRLVEAYSPVQESQGGLRPLFERGPTSAERVSFLASNGEGFHLRRGEHEVVMLRFEAFGQPGDADVLHLGAVLGATRSLMGENLEGASIRSLAPGIAAISRAVVVEPGPLCRLSFLQVPLAVQLGEVFSIVIRSDSLAQLNGFSALLTYPDNALRILEVRSLHDSYRVDAGSSDDESGRVRLVGSRGYASPNRKAQPIMLEVIMEASRYATHGELELSLTDVEVFQGTGLSLRRAAGQGDFKSIVLLPPPDFVMQGHTVPTSDGFFLALNAERPDVIRRLIRGTILYNPDAVTLLDVEVESNSRYGRAVTFGLETPGRRDFLVSEALLDAEATNPNPTLLARKRWKRLDGNEPPAIQFRIEEEAWQDGHRRVHSFHESSLSIENQGADAPAFAGVPVFDALNKTAFFAMEGSGPFQWRVGRAQSAWQDAADANIVVTGTGLDGWVPVFVRASSGPEEWTSATAYWICWDSRLGSISLPPEHFENTPFRLNPVLQGMSEPLIEYVWEVLGGPGSVIFDDDKDLYTLIRMTTEGTYRLRLSLVGKNGVFATAETDVHWDLTPPDPPSVSAPIMTANPRPQWSWTGASDGSGVFQVRLEAGSDTHRRHATIEETSYIAETDLPSGSHTLWVRERDKAGNWSTWSPSSVIIGMSPSVFLENGLSMSRDGVGITDGDTVPQGSAVFSIEGNVSGFTDLFSYASIYWNGNLLGETHDLHFSFEKSVSEWSFGLVTASVKLHTLDGGWFEEGFVFSISPVGPVIAFPEPVMKTHPGTRLVIPVMIDTRTRNTGAVSFEIEAFGATDAFVIEEILEGMNGLAGHFAVNWSLHPSEEGQVLRVVATDAQVWLEPPKRKVLLHIVATVTGKVGEAVELRFRGLQSISRDAAFDWVEIIGKPMQIQIEPLPPTSLVFRQLPPSLERHRTYVAELYVEAQALPLGGILADLHFPPGVRVTEIAPIAPNMQMNTHPLDEGGGKSGIRLLGTFNHGRLEAFRRYPLPVASVHFTATNEAHFLGDFAVVPLEAGLGRHLPIKAGAVMGAHQQLEVHHPIGAYFSGLTIGPRDFEAGETIEMFLPLTGSQNHPSSILGRLTYNRNILRLDAISLSPEISGSEIHYDADFLTLGFVEFLVSYDPITSRDFPRESFGLDLSWTILSTEVRDAGILMVSYESTDTIFSGVNWSPVLVHEEIRLLGEGDGGPGYDPLPIDLITRENSHWIELHRSGNRVIANVRLLAGWHYTLQRSSDLDSWEDVSVEFPSGDTFEIFSVSESGVFEGLDLGAASEGKVFFRFRAVRPE